MNLSPGMVVTVYFEGAHAAKRRPALVVSTDLYHSTRPDIIVAVLTTNVSNATTPTDYVLQDWTSAGLRYPTAFRAYFECPETDEILSIIGKLSDRDWLEVQAGCGSRLPWRDFTRFAASRQKLPRLPFSASRATMPRIFAVA